MTDLPIPLPVVYAGLGGTLLALIVATATNNWQPRVFFLLVLRLAIGWHFLFEGLHKIHSDFVGPSDTNRPFTSEPYFAAAEGPLGDEMRRRFLSDPDKLNAERLTPKRVVSAAEFDKLSDAGKAALCPDAVAATLGEKLDPSPKVETAKSVFAAWVSGVTGRDAKLKGMTGDPALTAPERLAHIATLQREYDDLRAWDREHLGNGYGIETKRVAAAKADLLAAKTDLVKDTDTFIAELRTLAGAKDDTSPTEKPIKVLDRVTRWSITAIGAGLLLGLFTRVWCVAGAGFLVMTYLSHPTVPWLPLPPMTEGNPLFVNKNVIEALALLALAVHPTGQWLGLDALLWLPFRRRVGGARPATA